MATERIRSFSAGKVGEKPRGRSLQSLEKETLENTQNPEYGLQQLQSSRGQKMRLHERHYPRRLVGTYRLRD